MKKFYLNTAGILCLYLMISFQASSQGCVAIRSGCGAGASGGAFLQKNHWQTGTNFRYFHSYRHFRGKHEETHRVEEGSEVINDSFFLDMLLSYGVTDRVSVNFVLPFVYHERSSMYEHGGNPKPDDPATPENEFWAGDRNTTSASGLGDVRLAVSYWILNPEKHPTSNFSVGVGAKFPTGDYRAQDSFYNLGENKNETVVSGVDQSIQPGDSGFGSTLEFQGYHTLSSHISLSATFYYLVNPKEKYTLETRGRMRDFSVSDQYAARLGALYMTTLHGLSLYAGGRVEGVPSSDQIGGDEGFRRPGYVISLEPGVTYAVRNTSFNLTVPIAVERNRTKNFSDKQNDRHGDAAFADYLINFSFAWRFGQKAPQIETLEGPIDIPE